MNNRLSLLLIGCIFPFLSFYAQKNMNLPPYYPTVKGITDYAVWQLVYPDSLLKADIAGEAVCTLRIDSLGIVRSKYIEATHPLFAKAAEDVIEGMREWQPAKKAGRDIDSTVVFHIPFNPDIYSDRIWRQQQVLESCRGQFVDSTPVPAPAVQCPGVSAHHPLKGSRHIHPPELSRLARHPLLVGVRGRCLNNDELCRS